MRDEEKGGESFETWGKVAFTTSLRWGWGRLIPIIYSRARLRAAAIAVVVLVRIPLVR